MGHARFCQFSLAIEGPFGAVLHALADDGGDERVSVAVLEPSPDYYRANYGSFPVFTLSHHEIVQEYWHAVSHEPEGDPTGSIAYTANAVCITGSTGTWAVWAERAWDLAIVLSKDANGSWESVGVKFVDAETALADFTEPEFKTPLSNNARAEFLDNVHKRGQLNRPRIQSSLFGGEMRGGGSPRSRHVQTSGNDDLPSS